MRRFQPTKGVRSPVAALALLLCVGLAPTADSAARRPVPASASGARMSRFANISMEVSNPTTAANAAERTLRKLGGTIQHSSSNTDNGSISAFVPISQLNAAMRALGSISGRVTNSSTSSSDLTSSMRNAKDRLADLKAAEGELAKAMKAASTAESTRGLVVLHELANRERQNLQNQVDNFAQQVKRAQINISFSRPR